MTQLSDDGQPLRWAVIDNRQAICRSDDSTGTVMGIFKPAYQMHQYGEWRFGTVSDTLAIAQPDSSRRGHRLG